MVNDTEKKLNQMVTDARRDSDLREQGYRAKALKMYPHICGRCAREFSHKNLHELTVHHRDHNHSYNPQDGSNWELLCLYCHDNEHQRQLEAQQNPTSNSSDKHASGTFSPFADLKSLLENKE